MSKTYQIRSKPSPITPEQYAQRVLDVTNGEYQVLSDYTRTKNPILMKHMVCGYEWWVKPNNFNTGTRCPACSYQRRRKSPERFEAEFYQKHSSDFKLLTPYRTAKEKVTVLHEECGYRWSAYPTTLLQSSGCPLCSKEERYQRLSHFMKEWHAQQKKKEEGCKK